MKQSVDHSCYTQDLRVAAVQVMQDLIHPCLGAMFQKLPCTVGFDTAEQVLSHAGCYCSGKEQHAGSMPEVRTHL